MPDLFPVSYEDIDERVTQLAEELSDTPMNGVYGIPRGGAIPAALLAGRLHVPLLAAPQDGCVVIDDLVDTGRTFEALREAHGADWMAVALYRKSWSPEGVLSAPAVPVPDNAWIVFPWEDKAESAPTDAVVRLLSFIGEDPTRDGLIDTPSRVVRALAEMTQGYQADVPKLLSTTFDVACDEVVLVRDIDFVSLCEHHMLPFTGTATVGYKPGARVVGLSKVARLVDAYAQRLQVQERMTNQIADAMVEHLGAEGVGVVLSASHGCMSCRGIRKSGVRMVTSALRGLFREDARARAEFLALAGC